MILESRDIISLAPRSAYSDFMASLDRATQTRKSSLCTTQFYKNIHISRVDYFITICPHPSDPPDTNPPLSINAEMRIFQTIRGRNFPSETTFKQSWPVTVQVTATIKVGKTPPRKYCTLPIRTRRIGKGKSEAATAPPIHTHFSHAMTPLCALRARSGVSVNWWWRRAG